MDGLLGYVRQYEAFGTTVHHIVTVAILGSVLFTGKDASTMNLVMALAEITNPLLSLMEFIKFFDWRPPLSVIIQLTFVFTFVTIRGPGMYYYFNTFFISDADFFLKIFMSAIWLISMNYVWMTINLAIKIGNQVKLEDLESLPFCILLKNLKF